MNGERCRAQSVSHPLLGAASDETLPAASRRIEAGTLYCGAFDATENEQETASHMRAAPAGCASYTSVESLRQVRVPRGTTFPLPVGVVTIPRVGVSPPSY